MVLDQLASRVVRRHVVLLCLATAVGLALGAVAALGQGSGYVATATVAVTSEAPTTDVEARAVVERARAMATSRAVVRSALESAGLSTDVDSALPDIRVEGIGSSALVRLEVRRNRAGTAQKLADALATKLVKRIDTAASEPLDERIAALGTQESQLPAGAPELSALRAERVRLQSQVAALPHASVVDRPALPTGTGLLAPLRTAGLGAAYGLLTGLVLALLLELARPGLIGLGAIAQALSVPSLGTPAGWLRGGDLSGVARRLRLLAAARGADTVVVVPLRQSPDTAILVTRLRAAVAEDTPEDEKKSEVRSVLMRAQESGGMLVQTQPRIENGKQPLRVCTLGELQPSMAGGAVAVLVTPSTVRRRELDDVLDLCSATGVMLAGVVGRPRTVAPLPPSG
jgi:hypothetical protein